MGGKGCPQRHDLPVHEHTSRKKNDLYNFRMNSEILG
jgi:hypothetical protein